MAMVGASLHSATNPIFCELSRTREMNISTQEAEEKRKQLLAKELAVKRNLSLVRKIDHFSNPKISMC